MEEFLNFSEPIETLPGLEYELEKFFDVELNGSGTQEYHEQAKTDLPGIDLEMKNNAELNILSEGFDLGEFLQETESSFDVSEQELFLYTKGKSEHQDRDEMNSKYLNDDTVHIFGDNVDSVTNIGLSGIEQKSLEQKLSTKSFTERRCSVVSDTITPINSRTNSPGRKNNMGFDSALRANIAEVLSRQYKSRQNDGKLKVLESLQPKGFPLSPTETPRKNKQRTRKTTSTLSSCNVKTDSLMVLKDEKCSFKPAPKSKSNLYLRPERRCPKFQFGIRSRDNIVNVTFKGGFIRNSIMNWYFEPNIPLPNNFQDVTIDYDKQFYPKMLHYIEDKIKPFDNTLRTYWKMIKMQDGPFIKLSLSPQSLDCDPLFSSTQYYFNVISRIVRPKSFGPIESGARYRAKMVLDMKIDDSSGQPRWCHFITSAEMKGILDFIFDGLDYIANDDTLPEKIRKGIKPNPFKQHESRIRSHMVGYVSGKKCLKKAGKLLSGERKFFAEEMYKQVIGYNDKKRPYNTLKEFAVMEVKYLMDNIEDLFGKFYWVDPNTVPPGGYPVRY